MFMRRVGPQQRSEPLICLLARVGWQRDPSVWTVRCRDDSGTRSRLRVQLTSVGIAVVPASPGPWILTPLQSGRLRGAMLDALLSFDQLGSASSATIRARSGCDR